MRFPRGANTWYAAVSAAVYVYSNGVSGLRPSQYSRRKPNPLITLGEAYEILENLPSVPELCVKVPRGTTSKAKGGRSFFVFCYRMVAVASCKPHDCDR